MIKNEFLLFDRIEKIKQINEEYNLEKNAYISFSGGKDSTILSKLIDLALPNNQIPRVFANTGIEYNDIVRFVKELSLKDNRFIILNQTANIKDTLEKYGYPFKSKEFSMRVYRFNQGLSSDFIKKYLSDESTKYKCPKKLCYIFKERGEYNYSHQCCYRLKKTLLNNWARENQKKITITGMRQEEGGNRKRLSCLTNNGKMFHPLVPIHENWMDWFIEQHPIPLCKLYYPPFNFKRTGCKGCPFNLNIQKDLDTMKKLLPDEYKQCEILWKPVYDEYRRIGYRLRKKGTYYQMSIDDFL